MESAESSAAADQGTSTRIFSQTFQNDAQQERAVTSEASSYSGVSEQGSEESDGACSASSTRDAQNVVPQGASGTSGG